MKCSEHTGLDRQSDTIEPCNLDVSHFGVKINATPRCLTFIMRAKFGDLRHSCLTCHVERQWQTDSWYCYVCCPRCERG